MSEWISNLLTLAIPILLIWWAVRHFMALSGKVPSNPAVYYIKGADHYHRSRACPQIHGRRMRKTTRRMAAVKGLKPCGHCYISAK